MNVEESGKTIIVITATYSRPGQEIFIRRLANVLIRVPAVFWIVVEDSDKENPAIKKLIEGIGINSVYLYSTSKMDMGNTPKNIGLKYIKENNLSGIIYIADDDNFYQRKLFDEIRKVHKVGILPVGNLGPEGIEKPVVNKGQVVDWAAAWKERRYPVDWAAIVFSSDFLKGLGYPFIGRVKGNKQFPDMRTWDIPRRKKWLADYCEGESEFLERILVSQNELEILCVNCSRCYVWHNVPFDSNFFVFRLLFFLRRRLFRICTLFR